MRIALLAAALCLPLSAAAQGAIQPNTMAAQSPDTRSPAAIASLDPVTDGMLGGSNRVYTLPPEVDVETTGSIAGSCVGETTGAPLCPEPAGPR